MDENHLDDDQGMPDESINISDVIEVIEEDPDFKESTMFNGGGQITRPSPSATASNQSSNRYSSTRTKRLAYVKIVEQPAAKSLRFRYECEVLGRSAGSIPGASSTSENKTFPTIQVVGYTGRAVVVVSCVTKDKPYRPHPHNIVGREGCKKGVCTMEIPPETMSITFSNLGIQCIKKKEIEQALRVREEIKVDPFFTGFAHRNQPTTIDLNAVRLCFQVFLEGDTPGKFTVSLDPVVSQPIYDKKAMCDLTITKLSDCVSYVDGGRKEIILLCEKVAKEDIQIRFYEEKDGKEVWEGFGEFQPSQVHKQVAIWFRAPRYHTLDITEPVRVFIQLRRPTDGATSEPLPFEFLPLDSEPGKRKRAKLDERQLLKQFEERTRENYPYLLNIPTDSIKVEPRDKTPSPFAYHQGLSPAYSHHSQGVSPQYLGPSPPPSLDPGYGNLPNILPSISNIQMQTNWNIQTATDASGSVMDNNWNIPSGSILHINNNNNNNDLQGATCANVNVVNNLESVLLDLDTHQSELRPIEINSAELETNNLSEILNTNLSLSDINYPDQNMTDSLTRLANSTIDNICQNR